jgi:hypothetical protein
MRTDAYKNLGNVIGHNDPLNAGMVEWVGRQDG